MKLRFIAYHGTNKDRGNKMLSEGDMTVFLEDEEIKSRKDYWLGHGVYFFENDDYLAYKWCEDMYKHKYKNSNVTIEKVLEKYFIIESIIEVEKDEILDLASNTEHQLFYKRLVELFESKCKLSKKYRDKELHKNDCLVINYLNGKIPDAAFGVIRGCFISRDNDYKNLHTVFNRRYHIQLCVKNKKYIKKFSKYDKLDVGRINNIKNKLPEIDNLASFII